MINNSVGTSVLGINGEVSFAIPYVFGAISHPEGAGLLPDLRVNGWSSDPVDSLAESIVCQCACHNPQSDFACMHFVPCCEGQCSHCGLWFEQGLVAHVDNCCGSGGSGK